MAIITMLGIDPSLTHTGWAVVQVDTVALQIVNLVDMGTIVTAPSKVKNVRKSSDDVARARAIATKLAAVIQQHGIKVGTCEVPSGGQSASAAKAFGIAIGILASLPIPLIEMSPREVKMATAGTAIADKEDMVRWAFDLTTRIGGVDLWEVGPKNDWEMKVGNKYVLKHQEHQADAICGTHAALRSTQFQQLAAMMNSLI